MNKSVATSSGRLCERPQALAACIALALTGTATLGHAAQTVTNCNDSGAGSLRSAITAAVEGDTVDMSALTCSRITLSSGKLQTSVNDLTIKGKGQQLLTIDGGSNSFGVIRHMGTGTLAITDLTISHAYYIQGGCIATNGSASLTRTTLSYCTSTGNGGTSFGGAVGALKNVTLTSSTIFKNNATDSTDIGSTAFGGGIFAGENVTVTDSTIDTNYATTGGADAGGGGIYALGTVTITDSTISHNTAIDVGGGYSAGGGVFAAGDITVVSSTFTENNAVAGGGLVSAGATIVVTNSTISANQATIGGGIATTSSSVRLNNSTVALNYAGGAEGGGGVVTQANAIFQSSIVGHNYSPNSTGAFDVSSEGHTVTITGANDLLDSVDSAITLPSGTIRSDPALASFLENNGGPTQTLVLSSSSPAVGKGNNSLRLSSDQRGPGFARMTGEKTDIGAYQTGTGIFANGFQ
jgi:hypothetical protein